VSRTCTAPLDRLKVLMQTQVSQPRSAPRSMAASIRASLGNLALATNAIYADGGVRSFWRGNGMNCVKIVPESAIKFYVFEQAKRAVAIFQGCDPDDPETNIGIAGRFVAGGAGGLCSQFSIYPIETLKTRVMAATHATSVPSSSSRASLGSAVTTFTSSTTTAAAPAATGSTVPRQVPPRSAIHLAAVPSRAMASLAAVAASPPRPVDPSGLIVSTARDMWREGGWRAFFRGLGPSLIGIVPYAGIDLAMYETLKGTYARMHPPATPGALSPEGYAAPPPTPPVMWLLIFGTISGSIGATAVYPLSLIRTRLQAQGSAGHPERYSGAMDVVRKTYQRESLRGFYKGLAPSLIKVIPAASISYACYEGMKTLVGL
ncbi:mitochondrial carrier domain-containing protein, partial [Blastocladiella britannica]